MALLTDEEAEAKVAAKGKTLTLTSISAPGGGGGAASLQAAVMAANAAPDGGFVRGLVCVMKVWGGAGGRDGDCGA